MLTPIRLRTIVSLLFVFLAGTAAIEAQPGTATAQAAAETWLALVDRAQYAESWQAAAPFFQNAVSQQKWAGAAESVRRPLGPLKSRTLKSSTSAKTLPGAPDGDYVVMQFNTAFEQKAAALETITVQHQPDSLWRVVGYFVR